MWYPEGYYSWNNALSDLRNSIEEVFSLVCSAGEQNPLVNGSPRSNHTVEFLIKREGKAYPFDSGATRSCADIPPIRH